MTQNTMYTLTPINIVNQYDDYGLLCSLGRITGETNWQYKRRILDVFVHLANSSYNGLINGITRELNLEFFNAIEINPRRLPDSNFMASDPFVSINDSNIYLYSDYKNNLLDYKIDRLQEGGNYEFIGSLVDLINTTTYFESSIINTDRYTRSATLLNQTNIGKVNIEFLPQTTKIKMNNEYIVRGSLFFSNKRIFRTEVVSINKTGDYIVDYLNGIITVYTVPDTRDYIRYSYIKYPFIAIGSPVILHDINNEDFKNKLFEQILQYNREYIGGLPTELGTDIINELLSLYSNYWGV